MPYRDTDTALNIAVSTNQMFYYLKHVIVNMNYSYAAQSSCNKSS